MLHPLYTVFTVEFGFSRWKIWFSSTLSPNVFKNYAPVPQISGISDFM